MLRVDLTAAASFCADGMTAVAGAYNALWLSRQAYESRAERRSAALVLALLNVAVSAEAVLAEALFSAHRFDRPSDALFTAQLWLPARLLVLCGTLLLSALILRRRRDQ